MAFRIMRMKVIKCSVSNMLEAAVSIKKLTISLGLSLREIIRTFKWQTLVLFKSILLQPKVR